MKLSDLPPRLRRLLESKAAAAFPLTAPVPRRSKYGSHKTAVGLRSFDSAKEARRYQQLVLMEKTGMITDLQLQVPFDLSVNGIPICRYVADFVYHRGGLRVVEDVKSKATRTNRAYRIKVKLMQAIFGITISEV